MTIVTRACVVLALSALALGCINSDTVQCGDLVCSTTDVCVAGSCVPRAALEVCDSKSDGADCKVDGVGGTCGNGICQILFCGNHRIDGNEACDDGNTVDGDGCNSTCTSDETCGNGFVDGDEGCDCGDADHLNPHCQSQNSDDETAECRVDCTPHSCGDGLQEGAEQCDAIDLDGKDCDKLGYYGGTLGCNGVCQFDFSSCGGHCGDGIVDDALDPVTHLRRELCEPGNTDTALPTCVDSGYDEGTTTCASYCQPTLQDCRRLGWAADFIDGSPVWGASPTDVFAGTTTGVSHFDGVNWTPMTVPVQERVFQICGSSSTDVFALTFTNVLHYDGSSWQQSLAITTDASPHAMACASGRALVGGAQYGYLMMYDGSAWAPVAIGPTGPFSSWGAMTLFPDGAGVAGFALSEDIDQATHQILSETIYQLKDNAWSAVSTSPMITPQSMWASSLTDLYLGGDATAHWDGTRWTSIQLGVGAPYYANAIHGHSATDVVILVGQSGVQNTRLARFDGTDWRVDTVPGQAAALWDGGNGTLFVGPADTGRPMLHYYGAQFTNGDPMTLSSAGSLDSLRSVGGDPTQLFAVGDHGTAFRFNGSYWSGIPGDLGFDLNAVSNVFVVGDYGALMRWDGSRLAAIPLPGGVTPHLTSVWAPSASEAWAAGFNGHVYHVTGAGTPGVTVVDTVATPDGLTAIWGAANNDIYAGSATRAVHFNGTAWSTVNIGVTTPNVVAISGTSASHVVVATDTVIQVFNGTVWTALISAPPTHPSWVAIYDVNPGPHASTPDTIVVDKTGGYWHLITGMLGQITTTGQPQRGQILTAGGDSSRVYMAGSQLNLFEWTAGFGSAGLGPLELVSPNVSDTVASLGRHDTYAAAISGSVYDLVHHDGVWWSRVHWAVGVTPAVAPVLIGGSSVDDVHVVGEPSSGPPVWRHWDGTTWTTFAAPPNLSMPDCLVSVSSTDAWACSGPKMRHFDGTAWAADVATGATSNLRAAVALGPDDILAVGIAGEAVRYHGGTWSVVPTPTTSNLLAMAVVPHATTGARAIAVGDHGTIIAWDGTAWSSQTSGTNLLLGDVAVTDDGVRFAVGFRSGILFTSTGGPTWTPVRFDSAFPTISVTAVPGSTTAWFIANRGASSQNGQLRLDRDDGVW